MQRERSVFDASRLPTMSFGARDIMWWGTAGFVVIEGWTLALVAGSYLYLRKNFVTWPPEHTPLPDLRVPTIALLVMLASLPVAQWTDKATKRLDFRRTTIGLCVLTVFALAFLIFRWFEFWATNVRWDTNAYGSAAWNVLGFHATLLILEAGEVLGIAVFFLVGRAETKHLSDAHDLIFYWYFMILGWIPLYLLVFFSPRML